MCWKVDAELSWELAFTLLDKLDTRDIRVAIGAGN